MSKLEDIRLDVQDCNDAVLRGFETLQQLSIERQALDDAEYEVARAYRDMGAAKPDAVEFVLEWIVNSPRLDKFVAEYLRGDAYWKGTITDLMADAMSAYAERNL